MGSPPSHLLATSSGTVSSMRQLLDAIPVMNTGQWISIILLACGVLAFLYVAIRPIFRRQRNDFPLRRHETNQAFRQPPPELDHASSAGPASSDPYELNGLTRQLLDELDGKIQTLQTLLVQADDRIRRMQLQGWPELANETATIAAQTNGAKSVVRHETTDPMTRQILELADQGLSVLDIAHRTGQAIGKIELIIALRGQ